MANIFVFLYPTSKLTVLLPLAEPESFYLKSQCTPWLDSPVGEKAHTGEKREIALSACNIYPLVLFPVEDLDARRNFARLKKCFLLSFINT